MGATGAGVVVFERVFVCGLGCGGRFVVVTLPKILGGMTGR